MPGPLTYAQAIEAQRIAETTRLAAEEERRFQRWAQTAGIQDVDHPDSYYDYRGYWKKYQPPMAPRKQGEHFTDEFKQHGHPTFSNESQYADETAGSWEGEKFTPTPQQAEDRYLRRTMTVDPDLAERLWRESQRIEAKKKAQAK